MPFVSVFAGKIILGEKVMNILKRTMVFRLISSWIIFSFVTSTVIPPSAYAQALNLPAPGLMVLTTPAYMPVMMKGVQIHPDNPLLFDFILDTGKSSLKVDSTEFKAESQKLIKYFLASLTIKEDDLWVNLSPYEKDRMIPDELGRTELGRDMLAQDYILKQLTASLIYPEKELGQKFWNTIYAKAQQQFGSSDIPVDTFNKVWIVADRAKVLERNNAAYVVGSHLKVMLEEDYVALENQTAISQKNVKENKAHTVASQILREIVIPEIEKEVNEGENFAPLRQMFYSMILASWYKVALKDALLNQVYSNREKTAGVLADDPAVKEKIYQQYLQAYKKGVFDYIKEDYDAVTQEVTPRKYFSGGELLGLHVGKNLTIAHEPSRDDAPLKDGDLAMVTVNVEKSGQQSKKVNIVDGQGKTLGMVALADYKTAVQEVESSLKTTKIVSIQQGESDISIHPNMLVLAQRNTPKSVKDAIRVLFGGEDMTFTSTASDWGISYNRLTNSPRNLTLLANDLRRQVEAYKKDMPDGAMTAESVKQMVQDFLLQDLTVEYRFSIDTEESGRDVIVRVAQTNRNSPPLLSMTVSANYQALVNKFSSGVSLVPMASNDEYVLQFKIVDSAMMVSIDTGLSELQRNAPVEFALAPGGALGVELEVSAGGKTGQKVYMSVNHNYQLKISKGLFQAADTTVVKPSENYSIYFDDKKAVEISWDGKKIVVRNVYPYSNPIFVKRGGFLPDVDSAKQKVVISNGKETGAVILDKKFWDQKGGEVQVGDNKVFLLPDGLLSGNRHVRVMAYSGDKTGLAKEELTVQVVDAAMLALNPRMDFPTARNEVKGALGRLLDKETYEGLEDVDIVKQLREYIIAKLDQPQVGQFISDIFSDALLMHINPENKKNAFRIYGFIHLFNTGIIGIEGRNGEPFIQYFGYSNEHVRWASVVDRVVKDTIDFVRREKAVKDAEYKTMIVLAGAEGLRGDFDFDSFSSAYTAMSRERGFNWSTADQDVTQRVFQDMLNQNKIVKAVSFTDDHPVYRVTNEGRIAFVLRDLQRLVNAGRNNMGNVIFMGEDIYSTDAWWQEILKDQVPKLAASFDNQEDRRTVLLRFLQWHEFEVEPTMGGNLTSLRVQIHIMGFKSTIVYKLLESLPKGDSPDDQVLNAWDVRRDRSNNMLLWAAQRTAYELTLAGRYEKAEALATLVDKKHRIEYWGVQANQMRPEERDQMYREMAIASAERGDIPRIEQSLNAMREYKPGALLEISKIFARKGEYENSIMAPVFGADSVDVRGGIATDKGSRGAMSTLVSFIDQGEPVFEVAKIMLEQGMDAQRVGKVLVTATRVGLGDLQLERLVQVIRGHRELTPFLLEIMQNAFKRNGSIIAHSQYRVILGALREFFPQNASISQEEVTTMFEQAGLGKEKPEDQNDGDNAMSASSPSDQAMMGNLRNGLDALRRIEEINEQYGTTVGRQDVQAWRIQENQRLRAVALKSFETAIKDDGIRDNVVAFETVANQFSGDANIDVLLGQGKQLMDNARNYRRNVGRYMTPQVVQQMWDGIETWENQALGIFMQVVKNKKPELFSSSAVSRGDNAMKAPGGIDLNAKNMGLDIAKDGNGIEMKFDPAMITEFQEGNFSGVQGIILRIIPIQSPLPILGLDTDPAGGALAKG